MATKFSRTWWGERFIEALENFTDEARLGRGRSYARNGKILNYAVKNGKITAKVKGSINPYFGVYKEPKYNVSIEIKQISATEWAKAIQQMATKASIVSKLLLNEMPDTIGHCFSRGLLPNSSADFNTTCSCPDYANPCKHIAGVYYLIASQLDEDPFLLFELRGLSRSQLQQELAKSTLGKILSSALGADTETEIVTANAYYTRPEPVALPQSIDLKDFWGSGQINMPEASPATIPAILIKKAGDYPAFWKRDNSFIEVMEDFYKRVRDKGLN